MGHSPEYTDRFIPHACGGLLFFSPFPRFQALLICIVFLLPDINGHFHLDFVYIVGTSVFLTDRSYVSRSDPE